MTFSLGTSRYCDWQPHCEGARDHQPRYELFVIDNLVVGCMYSATSV